ncbi:hypothetical protein AB0O22_39300 [Streptomyces sp. NPDC091204]|uniref:hypothetical protein n=1 Tax=Streptomyces sp. NPDC091204 TaxID=3155299 RepID=UPI0034247A85
MEHARQHMYDVVDALVRAGSSFRPRPPGMGDDPFWLAKGEPHCYLETPIDFAVAKDVPGQPEEVVFAEDNDMISCELCWTVITGTAYRPETVWDRRP